MLYRPKEGRRQGTARARTLQDVRPLSYIHVSKLRYVTVQSLAVSFTLNSKQNGGKRASLGKVLTSGAELQLADHVE